MEKKKILQKTTDVIDAAHDVNMILEESNVKLPKKISAGIKIASFITSLFKRKGK